MHLSNNKFLFIGEWTKISLLCAVVWYPTVQLKSCPCSLTTCCWTNCSVSGSSAVKWGNISCFIGSVRGLIIMINNGIVHSGWQIISPRWILIITLLRWKFNTCLLQLFFVTIVKRVWVLVSPMCGFGSWLFPFTAGWSLLWPQGPLSVEWV